MVIKSHNENPIKEVGFEERNGKLYATRLAVSCISSRYCPGTMVFQDFAVGLVSWRGVELYPDPHAVFTKPHSHGPWGRCARCRGGGRVSDEVLEEVMKRAKQFRPK